MPFPRSPLPPAASHKEAGQGTLSGVSGDVRQILREPDRFKSSIYGGLRQYVRLVRQILKSLT